MYTHRCLILIGSSSYIVILYRNCSCYWQRHFIVERCIWKLRLARGSSVPSPSLYPVSGGTSSVLTRRTCRSNKLCPILRGQTVELAWRASRSSLPRMRQPPGCRSLADRPEAVPTGSGTERSRADRDDLLPSMRLDSRQACSRRSGTVIWNCAPFYPSRLELEARSNLLPGFLHEVISYR